MTYEEFRTHKSQLRGGDGFKPNWMPDFLFDFQSDLTSTAIEHGRFALFEDCGPHGIRFI